jgi:hypothetical protein
LPRFYSPAPPWDFGASTSTKVLPGGESRRKNGRKRGVRRGTVIGRTGINREKSKGRTKN